jgi:hypothetical protein
MLTFTVEELIRFLSNWTMTFFEGAKRSGDIVFSRYYSFFKHPVLVREHQVESLYVMVQNRDSSDNKKPSFSRFAKWEFGGFHSLTFGILPASALRSLTSTTS